MDFVCAKLQLILFIARVVVYRVLWLPNFENLLCPEGYGVFIYKRVAGLGGYSINSYSYVLSVSRVAAVSIHCEMVVCWFIVSSRVRVVRIWVGKVRDWV